MVPSLKVNRARAQPLAAVLVLVIVIRRRSLLDYEHRFAEHEHEHEEESRKSNCMVVHANGGEMSGSQQHSRREFLFGLGAGLGSLALTAMLADELKASNQSAGQPLAPKPAHCAAKAKRCIFLMMEGGPSHIDTFDPKPKLASLHLQEFVREGQTKSAMESGKRYYVQSPFRFRKVGKSGLDMAENWEQLAQVADEICFYRGCQVDSVNHPTAMYQMNTGNRFVGDPAIGAWVTYGLGSENQDLPGFIVLPARGERTLRPRHPFHP